MASGLLGAVVLIFLVLAFYRLFRCSSAPPPAAEILWGL